MKKSLIIFFLMMGYATIFGHTMGDTPSVFSVAHASLIRVISSTQQALIYWKRQRDCVRNPHELVIIKKKIIALRVLRDYFMSHLGLIIQQQAQTHDVSDLLRSDSILSSRDVLKVYKKFPDDYRLFLYKHALRAPPSFKAGLVIFTAAMLCALATSSYLLEHRFIIEHAWYYCCRVVQKAKMAFEWQIKGLKEALDDDPDKRKDQIVQEQKELALKKEKYARDSQAFVDEAMTYLKRDRPGMTADQERAIRQRLLKGDLTDLSQDLYSRTDTTWHVLRNPVSNAYNIMLHAKGFFAQQGMPRVYGMYSDALDVKSTMAPVMGVRNFALASAAGLPAFLVLGIAAWALHKVYQSFSGGDPYKTIRDCLLMIEFLCITKEKTLNYDTLEIGRLAYYTGLLRAGITLLPRNINRRLRVMSFYLADPGYSAQQKRLIVDLMRRILPVYKNNTP